MRSSACSRSFFTRLVEIQRAGKKAVVLIDEAQMLASKELMEEFRGLLNLELPGRKLINFVLFGMPEIDEVLALDPPLAQRIAMRCRPFLLRCTHLARLYSAPLGALRARGAAL